MCVLDQRQTTGLLGNTEVKWAIALVVDYTVLICYTVGDSVGDSVGYIVGYTVCGSMLYSRR